MLGECEDCNFRGKGATCEVCGGRIIGGAGAASGITGAIGGNSSRPSLSVVAAPSAQANDDGDIVVPAAPVVKFSSAIAAEVIEFREKFPHNFYAFEDLDTGARFDVKSGFGDVVRGFLKSQNMHIAAKFFRDTSKIKLNIRECMIALRANHQHIAKTVGVTIRRDEAMKRDQLVMIMELCEGNLEDILKRVKATGGLDWRRAYEYSLQIAKGLRYLHNEIKPPVIHLDLKPENCLSKYNGTVLCLADFGLSRENEEISFDVSRGAGGTLLWMPPEQMTSRHVSSTNDVYSFGAILYYFLTGRRPWEGATAYQIQHGNLVDHFTPDKLRAGCPPALAELCFKCIQPNRANRPKDGADLVAQLEAMQAPSDTELSKLNFSYMPGAVPGGNTNGSNNANNNNNNNGAADLALKGPMMGYLAAQQQQQSQALSQSECVGNVSLSGYNPHAPGNATG